MISEVAPAKLEDYYYAKGEPLFAKTTVQAFNEAGVKVASIPELVGRGMYFTTAVKCGKTDSGLNVDTIKSCSWLLEKELSLFSKAKVLMLMGDVAIRSLNYIAQRSNKKRVIPAGSTYKIREQKYFWGDKRVFPSYLQAGPSFLIEKSKRRMIAEDIAKAIKIIE
ncbi:MAG: uracil-DNA glycosylase [Desulfobacteraceae bacterium]|nr:MAG: uracil-DNA glycosylase [Desulfobacteraceae bacterium]